MLLIVVPGPNVLFILSRGIAGGRRTAFASAVGVELGTLVHVVGTVIGLSALIAASPSALAVVKYAGAAYLVYLGLRKLLVQEEAIGDQSIKPESLAQIYWQGFAINLLNPKTALFFFAFLPQFVDPARGNVTIQTLLLGVIFVGMAIITDSLYALLASSLADRLRDSRHFQKGQRYFAGLVYVGLGITTALTGSKK